MPEKFEGIVDSTEKALGDFAQDVVNYTQRTADYYEEKKYKFLTISIAILGFGATLIGVFREEALLVLGSLVMMVFSLAAVLIYLVGSMPTQELKREFAPSVRSATFSIDRKKDAYTNYNTYFKKFKKMTKEEILKDNVSQAMTLFYLCEEKRRVIERMSWLMFLGLACFFIFVVAFAAHFLV